MATDPEHQKPGPWIADPKAKVERRRRPDGTMESRPLRGRRLGMAKWRSSRNYRR